MLHKKTFLASASLLLLLQNCSFIIDTNPDGVIPEPVTGGRAVSTGLSSSGASAGGAGGVPVTSIGGSTVGGTLSTGGIVGSSGSGAGSNGGTTGGALFGWGGSGGATSIPAGGATTGGTSLAGGISSTGGIATGGAPPSVVTLTLAPTTQAFPSVAVDSASTASALTVTNTGNASAGTTTAIAVKLSGTNAAEFHIDATTCSGTLVSGTSCTITASFHPTSAAAKTATVTVTATPGNTVSATLTGTGLAPGALSISPQTVTFPSTLLGATSAPAAIQVSNTGSTAVGTTSSLAITLGGTNPGDFSISSTTCGATLAGGANCTAQVVFKPTTSGSKSAMLNASATPGGSASATLSGEATAPCSMIADAICPSNCSFSTDIDCKKADGQSCGAAAECRSGTCPFGTCCGQSTACPQCQFSSHCTSDVTKPICSNGTCVACQNGGNAACAAKNPAMPICALNGPAATVGACVECYVQSNCSADVTRPICSNNKCAACVVDTDCSTKDSTRSKCLASGTCVQCSQNIDCNVSKSYCDEAVGTCLSCTQAVSVTPDYTCQKQYPDDPYGYSPGCVLSSGVCARCLTGKTCGTSSGISGYIAEGICASDNTTCTATTCTSKAQCGLLGGSQAECINGLCLIGV